MKKFITLMTATISFFCVSQYAFAGPNFYISFEGRGLFFKNHIEEDLNLIKVDYRDSHSVRGGIGAFLGDHIDIGFFYSRLKTESNIDDSIENNVTCPTSVPKDCLFVNQNKTRYKNEIYDMEIGYNFKIYNASLRLMAGARYANYNLDIVTRISNTTYNTTNHTNGINTDDNFHRIGMEGIGPRGGFTFSHPLFIGNLSIKAEGNFAALFTKQKIIRNQVSYKVFSAFSGAVPDESKPHNHRWQTGVATHQDWHYEDENIIYNFDANATLEYVFELYENVSLILSAGYQYEMQDNLITEKLNNIYKQMPNGISPYTDYRKIINHGPFLKAEMRF